MHIKPRPGMRLVSPGNKRVVPQEGMQVPDGDLHWQRRIDQGDAELAEPPAEGEPQEQQVKPE